MGNVEIKICGITDKEAIHIAAEHDVNYLGFVFFKNSVRNLSLEKSKFLTSLVPKKIKKVAVMVKPENSFIKKIKDQFDYLQIYECTPSELKEKKSISGKKIIQAFKIKKELNVKLYKNYLGIADDFLFDGGSSEYGKSSNFNWNYLKSIKNSFFLAGGININNIDQAIKISKKIDISSSLEDNPGKKSTQKISDFLLKVRSL